MDHRKAEGVFIGAFGAALLILFWVSAISMFQGVITMKQTIAENRAALNLICAETPERWEDTLVGDWCISMEEK